jgi:uncharacterized membrane protein
MAVALLAAASLAAVISGHTDNAEGRQLAAGNVITLRVCNHTNTATLVGSSFIPIGGSAWRNKGWTKVNAGACRDIFSTTNRTFYARAEVQGHSDEYWGADIKQCVEYPGPYDFMTSSSDTTCPEGEPAPFTTFHSDGRAVYIWNLNP